MLGSFFLFLSAAVISFAASYLIIFVSRLVHAGQSIRAEGPAQHMKKAGTPTFGGAAIFVAFFITVLIFVDLDPMTTALMLAVGGAALIGFLDDYLKVGSGCNEGLDPVRKMALQIIVALVFGTVLLLNFHDQTVSGLLKAVRFDLPWLYLPLAAFIMVGTSNAANLTDGLDGLLAGLSIAAFLAFAVIALKVGHHDIFGICLAAAGSGAGFLALNMNPAKIFMGDVGSLGLGALLAGVAVILHKELLLIVIGGVLVVETLSVIIQVASFKLFKRRVFRMSPIHHHFELMGMKERNVVFLFWGSGLILGVMGILL